LATSRIEAACSNALKRAAWAGIGWYSLFMLFTAVRLPTGWASDSSQARAFQLIRPYPRRINVCAGATCPFEITSDLRAPMRAGKHAFLEMVVIEMETR